MNKIVFTGFIAAIMISVISCQQNTQNEGANQQVLKIDPSYEPIIDSLINKMDLKTKVGFLHCTGKFVSGGNDSLGIPEFWYTDGPNSVREELERNSWRSMGLTTDSATFFPTGTALAATWSRELAFKYGEAIGKEARARNKDMLLGPAVNIIRTPLCGRAFEYFTEDPFLDSRITVGYVNGVQSMDVAACVKHFAANNQEFERGRISVDVSERALREIYLPAYKAAVEEADALGMMGAYNKFRGNYLCQNDYLNNKILKDDFGFKGIVVSDWGATHNTIEAALGGLDVEMGSRESDYDSCYFGLPLVNAVKEGKVPEDVVNDKVRRVLRVTYNLKMMDQTHRKKGELTTPAISKAAYDIASEAIVLLKNNNHLLPLSVKDLKEVAIIGVNAKQPQSFGGFTAGAKAKYEVSPFEGISKRLKGIANITYTPGYRVAYKRWVRPINEPNDTLIAEAVEAAKKADVALLFVGNTRNIETEGTDRKDIILPFGQDSLIQAVVNANPKTIVVVVAGSACDLNIAKEKSPALLYSWFNGSEAGNAIADVLIGKINPSGKMPFTLPKKLNDIAAHALNAYPGENHEVNYSEGILVGYRWFDTKKIEPLYPFGYGLSYTTFDYASASTDKENYKADQTVTVHVTVKNTGATDGKETIQCYVHAINSKVDRADKELKGFTKINIPAGTQKSADIKIKTNNLSYFDETLNNWVLEPGEYSLLIGSSSRDIKQTIYIKIAN